MVSPHQGTEQRSRSEMPAQSRLSRFKGGRQKPARSPQDCRLQDAQPHENAQYTPILDREQDGNIPGMCSNLALTYLTQLPEIRIVRA